MSTLLKLPDEIFSEILFYLIEDKRILCNLASQSKRLSELVHQILV
jgi:hypothetical protein